MTSFKYFRVVRIEKQIRFVFCEEFMARLFYFQIYWPLALVHLIPSLPGLGRNRVFGACCSLPKRPINRFKPVLVKGDNSNQVSLTTYILVHLIQRLVWRKIHSPRKLAKMEAHRHDTFVSKLTLESLLFFKMSGFCRRWRYNRGDGRAMARRRHYGGGNYCSLPTREVPRSAYDVCSVFWVRPKKTMGFKIF